MMDDEMAEIEPAIQPEQKVLKEFKNIVVSFEGEKVKIDTLENKEVAVINYAIRTSTKFGPENKFVVVQAMTDFKVEEGKIVGGKKIVFNGGGVLCGIFEQSLDHTMLPIRAKIVRKIGATSGMRYWAFE